MSNPDNIQVDLSIRLMPVDFLRIVFPRYLDLRIRLLRVGLGRLLLGIVGLVVGVV